MNTKQNIATALIVITLLGLLIWGLSKLDLTMPAPTQNTLPQQNSKSDAQYKELHEENPPEDF